MSASLTGLLSGTTYHFRVTATNVLDRAVGLNQTFNTEVPGVADLAITATHAGNFTQGDASDTYTIIVTNAGTAASSGMVTVVDTLPTGLTATAISGAGWTTNLGTLTCTRSDALSVGTAYPPITVNVTVAANAAANVTNTATVSGGGDASPANNTASDPTSISAATAPTATTGVATGIGTTGGDPQWHRRSQRADHHGAFRLWFNRRLWPDGLRLRGFHRHDDPGRNRQPHRSYRGDDVPFPRGRDQCSRRNQRAGPNVHHRTYRHPGLPSPWLTPATSPKATSAIPIPSPSPTSAPRLPAAWSRHQRPACWTNGHRNQRQRLDNEPRNPHLHALRRPGGGASYPAIIVTVSVATTPPANVTNTASVSGGSDTSLANNTANDPTTINPASSGGGTTTLVGWDVSGLAGGSGNFGSSPLASTTNAANLTLVAGLTRGTGVGVTGTAAARGWGGNNWMDTSSAAAITANRFATFTVAAVSGYNVSFATIGKFDYRHSGTGPTNGLLQYQVGSGAFTDVTALSYPTNTSGGASLSPIDLLGISALQTSARAPTSRSVSSTGEAPLPPALGISST